MPDVLTRIPINYLCRIVNVELFGFTITLERVLGVVSLGQMCIRDRSLYL